MVTSFFIEGQGATGGWEARQGAMGQKRLRTNELEQWKKDTVNLWSPVSHATQHFGDDDNLCIATGSLSCLIVVLV